MRKILLFLGIFFFTFPAFANAIPIYTEANTHITQSSNQPTFRIRLKSNPTTGYSWLLANYDKSNMTMVQHRYLPPTQMIAGAGGIEEWTFRLTQNAFSSPQRFEIELVYQRAWEKNKDSKKLVFYISTEQ